MIAKRKHERMFKVKAVLLSYERGAVKQIGKELGITPNMLTNWRREYNKFRLDSFCGIGNGKSRLSPTEQKIKELIKKAKQSERKFEILQKGQKYISQEKKMIFNFIENNENVYPLGNMCKIFQVSEMRYRRWKKQIISEAQLRIMSLQKAISSIYFENKQRWGSCKIHKELQSRGFKISSSAVQKNMRILGLRRIVKKKFKITTDSKHNNFIAPNILNRAFTVKDYCKVWVSDITYIRTTDSFLYLTIIMDLFDRKIIGWNLSNTLSTEKTIIPAWKMAINNRNIKGDLVFHSDRGVQYASRSFTKILNSHKTVIKSMSRKANSTDNAVAESFFKTLKIELIYKNKPLSKEQIKIEIFEFIEIWYNTIRIHSTLNYKTIKEFNTINKL